MSLDFYDRNGAPYAYSEDGETLYTFSGAPIGYILGDSIYRFDGTHIGYFNSGLLRDGRGNVLLFTPDAQGGPMKPMRSMKPMKSMRSMRPMRSMRSMKPMRPMNTMGWSAMSPEAAFES